MSIYSVKHGMTNAEIEDLLFCLAQFVNQSGVIATGDLAVTAQTTPDMTVRAAIGRAVLKTSDGRNGYPVYNDASANVTIAANSSGVAKIDAVVLYWDGAVSSDANASNVAKLTTVRGTASATPTDAEIQTAVGAGNPFLRLADVAVANGATSINSGNITDKRVQTDLNTPRAGGWTAVSDTWTYSSVDGPTFVITVPTDATLKYAPGMRIKLTQATGGTKYFIVTAVSATTLTVYGGTDYTLTNETITTPYYSMLKTPVGFPLGHDKWTASTSDTTSRVQASPTSGTWYNLGSVSLSIPIGAWKVEYAVHVGTTKATSVNVSVFSTLSSANNSESDADFTQRSYMQGASSTIIVVNGHSRRKDLTLSTKTAYYLNTKTDLASVTEIDNFNAAADGGKLIIRAVSAYL